MKHLYILHGLRRSGNHAVINWMKGMDRFLFFNNIVPVGKVFREGEHLLEAQPFVPWFEREIGRKRRNDLRRFRLKVLLEVAGPLIRNVMASLEDQDFEKPPFKEIPCPVHHMVLVRSAGNLFASRIKKGFERDSPLLYPRDNGPRQQQLVALWKKYAAYACDEMPARPDTVVICFDRWFADVEYRRGIAESLALPFSDRGFTTVAREGGGSSFDGLSYGDESTRMNVLSRAGNLNAEEKALFDDVFRDSGLQRLSEKLDNRFRLADPH